MKIYDLKTGEHIEAPKNVEVFIISFINLCKTHNLSIAHEDLGGRFEIKNYNEKYIDWIKESNLDI